MRQYVVDAFTSQVFRGNPAAVCLPDAWPTDELMRSIARENRFSETAFAVREAGGWRLRWFTPGGEIDLCGHATLATAYVILRFIEPAAREVAFDTLSGRLAVTRRDDGLLAMDFPAYEIERVEVTDDMARALGVRPVEAWRGRDLLCVLGDGARVRELSPDLDAVAGLDGLLVHVTARGEDGFDCVSRSFAPKLGVGEDPVCGSGHCHILPYWAARLGRRELVAYQASERGGVIHGAVGEGRVTLAGAAALFSEGVILER